MASLPDAVGGLPSRTWLKLLARDAESLGNYMSGRHAELAERVSQ